MEPEERYVAPYIKPLLDQPGSRYCHTHLVGAHPSRYWDSYRQINEDPTLLPPRPALPSGDPKLREFDPSLLVIGNLERAYQKIHHRIDLPQLILLQSSYTALTNELFQRSGLVRMLWWVPERMKHFLLTRNPMLRTAFSVGVEMGIEPTEVAGTTSLQVIQDNTRAGRKRAPLYDRLGIERVAQSMQDKGVSPPEGRELLGVDYERDLKPSERVHKSPFEFLAKTPAEIRERLSTASERLDKMGCYRGQNKDRTANLDLYETIEYPQSMATFEYSSPYKHIWRVRAALMIDIAIRIMHLEASYKELEDRSDDWQTLDALKSDILQLGVKFDAKAANGASDEPTIIADATEEIIAWYMSPQHSAFDRRAYEPLKLHSTDFFPLSNDLALIDLMPKSRDLSVPDLADSAEAAKICGEMLRQLFSAKRRPVIEALNTFAVNAGQDLVPMVPAIYDIRKGGRLNPKHVRAKMLTDEMVEGLVKAFFEWPFRPQTWELTAAIESAEAAGGGIEAQKDADVEVDGEE